MTQTSPLTPGMRAARDKRKRRVEGDAPEVPCSCVVLIEETVLVTHVVEGRGMLGLTSYARSETHSARLKRVRCFGCELTQLRLLAARERKGGPGIPLATRLPRVAVVVAELAEEVPIGRDEILELLGCGRSIDEILMMADEEDD